MSEHTRIPDPEHCPDPSVHGNPFRYCPYCTWTEEAAQELDPPANRPTLSDPALVEEAARRGMTVMDAAEAARLRGVEETLATVRPSVDIERLTAERDSAQEHLAYHLRDFRPGVDHQASGDLAVDMAAYAGRLKIERDQALAAVEQVRRETREQVAREIEADQDREGCGERDYCHGWVHANASAARIARAAEAVDRG